MNSIFEGLRRKTYKKYFTHDITSQSAGVLIEYKKINDVIEFENKLDGVFGIVTTVTEQNIEKEKIVACYKNLQEVEYLFDGLKNFVEIQPTRHWNSGRVRAHVFICILSLLLKRIFEINYNSKSITEPLEEISKLKMVSYKVPILSNNKTKIITQLTQVTEIQKKIFNRIGIKNPHNLEKYL